VAIAGQSVETRMKSIGRDGPRSLIKVHHRRAFRGDKLTVDWRVGSEEEERDSGKKVDPRT
jgi:hypothetical protein